MKLRLSPGSVRIRLETADLSTLLREGQLETGLRLGPDVSHTLVYAIELSSTAREPRVELMGNRLLILLPGTAARAWAETPEIGLYGTTPWGLSIAIEKDLSRGPRGNIKDRSPLEAGTSCGAGRPGPTRDDPTTLLP
jgi:hypothetical protein